MSRWKDMEEEYKLYIRQQQTYWSLRDYYKKKSTIQHKDFPSHLSFQPRMILNSKAEGRERDEGRGMGEKINEKRGRQH